MQLCFLTSPAPYLNATTKAITSSGQDSALLLISWIGLTPKLVLSSRMDWAGTKANIHPAITSLLPRAITCSKFCARNLLNPDSSLYVWILSVHRATVRTVSFTFPSLTPHFFIKHFFHVSIDLRIQKNKNVKNNIFLQSDT